MLNFTPLAKLYFDRLSAAAAAWKGRTREVQLNVLRSLVGNGRHTLWGETHGFTQVTDYDSFRKAIPEPPAYADIRPLVMRMVNGEKDILWPGVTRRFAQSSGTSDGKSKYIPVTDSSLRLRHYREGAHVIASYLSLYPDSRIFSGKSFILGGSFATELATPEGVRVGDLSANLIEHINPLANLIRVPSRQIALMPDWETKLPALVKAAANEDITNISGVPSWFLTVLRGILDHTGASTIHDVWPRLEVFFHGGIAMAPYRDEYARITDPAKMRYINCYNASEGFFGVQDSRDSETLLLMLDTGTFYEFQPVGSDKLIPAWEVEEGKIYALVITSCNGLWRYPLGDTVRIESIDPLRISIAGRTKSFINAFGEELMVDNADAAIARVCHDTGASVANYTAAPVYAEGNHRGRHEWLIEFDREPDSLEDFADRLDRALQQENSDYEAKRAHGIFLDRLSIVKGRPGVFDTWLKSTGRLGGQRKVPRLSNSRHPMDEILAFNSQ